MIDIQAKKAGKLQDGLTTKLQKAIKSPGKSNIQRAIGFIENNIALFNESKLEIIKNLIILKENQIDLKKETGKTFNEIIVEITGFSKSYFYQLIGNYEFLKQQKRVDLFDRVGAEVITKLKKIDDTRKLKKLLNDAESLTKADTRLIESDRSDSPKIINVDYVIEDSSIKITRGVKNSDSLYVNIDDKELKILTFDKGLQDDAFIDSEKLKNLIRNKVEEAIRECRP